MQGPQRTAFVTGATGFVGGRLAHALTGNGWRVIALCRSADKAPTLKALGLEPVLGDLADRASLERAIPQDVDAVFHVAADTSISARHKERQYANNVAGTANMVDAALAKSAKRFVHTSTCSAYGRHKERLTENTPSTAPQSWISYERTKWLAEEAVRAGVARGLNAVIINPCAIIGPGDRSSWASLFFKLKDGAMPVSPPGVATFNYIDDVVAAHIAAVDHGATGENFLLTGDEAPFSELIALMAGHLGVTKLPPRVPGWVLAVAARMEALKGAITGKEPDLTPEMAALMSADVLCATTKARDVLGLKHTPLKDCVAGSYNWLREQGLL